MRGSKQRNQWHGGLDDTGQAPPGNHRPVRPSSCSPSLVAVGGGFAIAFHGSTPQWTHTHPHLQGRSSEQVLLRFVPRGPRRAECPTTRIRARCNAIGMAWRMNLHPVDLPSKRKGTSVPHFLFQLTLRRLGPVHSRYNNPQLIHSFPFPRSLDPSPSKSLSFPHSGPQPRRIAVYSVALPAARVWTCQSFPCACLLALQAAPAARSS